jgi:hypothetical protein
MMVEENAITSNLVWETIMLMFGSSGRYSLLDNFS